MDEPLDFRVVFGALFLLLFGVVTRYRVKAQSGRKFDYSNEGGVIFLALRLGGAVPLAVLRVVRGLSRGAGVVIHRAALAVALGRCRFGVTADPVDRLGSAEPGAQRLPTGMTHEDHELVTDGPYRWIRNPLYTAGALFFTGNGLISASAFLLSGALIAVALVTIRLPSEEAELEKRFGQTYRDYVSRTGRFLPRLRRG